MVVSRSGVATVSYVAAMVPFFTSVIGNCNIVVHFLLQALKCLLYHHAQVLTGPLLLLPLTLTIMPSVMSGRPRASQAYRLVGSGGGGGVGGGDGNGGRGGGTNAASGSANVAAAIAAWVGGVAVPDAPASDSKTCASRGRFMAVG